MTGDKAGDEGHRHWSGRAGLYIHSVHVCVSYHGGGGVHT